MISIPNLNVILISNDIIILTQNTDIDECSSNSTLCDQTCANTFGSYECQCNPGFLLLDQRNCESNFLSANEFVMLYARRFCSYTFTDIDECAGINDCQQICTDTDGSFICGCETGYALDPNGKTCTGEQDTL